MEQACRCVGPPCTGGRWSCWAEARRPRTRRSWCRVTRSWCSAARWPGSGRTGPTARSWPPWPGCCQQPRVSHSCHRVCGAQLDPDAALGRARELRPPPAARGAAFYPVRVETLTFLFTDIEGSTTFLRKVGEDVYAQVLADHHALIRSALAAHGGAELNTLGDGFFAGFASPRACVAAVLEMQHALEAHDWPGREHVRVRMGVHTGEATQTPNGPVGLDVHRAARIAAVAHGGQVLFSETAAVLVRDALPAGAALRDLGAHRLKDLGRPERIFQLEAPGLGGRVRPASFAREPGAAEQPAGAADVLHRPRPRARRGPGASRVRTVLSP